ncbi:type I restriction endonuclease subunit R [Orbus wheelerorum]|uniref:type I restriction endonuclease subunit R n=1 Tax=Orbus wheelerorum TaxID=3074111 RepID=UPI00370DA48D
MAYQSELQLEDRLVKQLTTQGFESVSLNNIAGVRRNLKQQLERLNQAQLARYQQSQFSDDEFKQILNALAKGTVFEKAVLLRNKLAIHRADGSYYHIELLSADSSKNHYQITQQITVEGQYQNRYDVTILINGLPLVQIELKRRGIELKEAFNQINRYQRHSYWSEDGLFQFVQLFVISNGVNTRYYANNKSQSFKQTFCWADIDNKSYNELTDFAKVFLTPMHLNTMINDYMVLNSLNILMVMRSYQIYATQAIIKRINDKTSTQNHDENEQWNGYIWHTTGSGKTLTSFKTAQLVTAMPHIHKVVFVVDRKDLDFQTAKEFNSFLPGCIDSTDNTKILVDQLTDAPIDSAKANLQRNTKLVVTTIQKLNNAINNKRYLAQMQKLADKPLVFIFDECHRSQFGDTHKNITQFFTQHQLFGFTGTPIFADNAISKASIKQTTESLFHRCLHKYTIIDAIRDQNVLPFSVEYVGRYHRIGSHNELDIEVEGIDTKALLDSEARLDKISDYIIAHHNSKTHSREFTAMFCVSSVPMLIRYYDIFQRKKLAGEHNLRIATIFSYASNEDDLDANGIDDVFKHAAEPSAQYLPSRDKLEQYIADYNQMFASHYTTKDSKLFYDYYTDISKKVKERKIDILLVVNMFLTGFDSKTLNTLYVDKNLQYHGLVQAYSRTNRILNEVKSQGNIVVFRNLKNATDQALALFSNKQAQASVIIAPYDEHVKQFNTVVAELLTLTPTVKSVDELADEQALLDFVKTFRELIRLQNVLKSYADYDVSDLALNEQQFQNYLSKYLDLKDRVKQQSSIEKASILEEVDFELELIHRDDINVGYILRLLGEIKTADNDQEREGLRQKLLQNMASSPELRSKRDLIDEFIAQNLNGLASTEEINDALASFIEQAKQQALKALCQDEQLEAEKIDQLVDKIIFTRQDPIREEVFATRKQKPSLTERKTLYPRIVEKLKKVIDVFYLGW